MHSDSIRHVRKGRPWAMMPCPTDNHKHPRRRMWLFSQRCADGHSPDRNPRTGVRGCCLSSRCDWWQVAQCCSGASAGLSSDATPVGSRPDREVREEHEANTRQAFEFAERWCSPVSAASCRVYAAPYRWHLAAATGREHNTVWTGSSFSFMPSLRDLNLFFRNPRTGVRGYCLSSPCD